MSPDINHHLSLNTFADVGGKIFVIVTQRDYPLLFAIIGSPVAIAVPSKKSASLIDVLSWCGAPASQTLVPELYAAACSGCI